MIRHFVAMCFGSLLLVGTLSPLTYAHTLETDGTIGAILHISPNDDPRAGQKARLYFAVKDASGRFDSQDCSCTIRITDQASGRTVFTQTDRSVSAEAIFPRTGAYSVRLAGTPRTPSGFQPFELTYPLRVTQTATTSLQEQRVHRLVTSITAVLIVGAVVSLIIPTSTLRRRGQHSAISKPRQ